MRKYCKRSTEKKFPYKWDIKKCIPRKIDFIYWYIEDINSNINNGYEDDLKDITKIGFCMKCLKIQIYSWATKGQTRPPNVKYSNRKIFLYPKVTVNSLKHILPYHYLIFIFLSLAPIADIFFNISAWWTNNILDRILLHFFIFSIILAGLFLIIRTHRDIKIAKKQIKWYNEEYLPSITRIKR